jgi:triosephosphate isomerase (TIM)
MHKTIKEACDLAASLVENLKNCSHTIMVAPPFTALSAVKETVKGSGVLVGAQNMCSVESGAHTGEVSVLMLKDLGVEIVILGHSERRHVYAETNSLINEKVKLALSHELEVILCVGELIEERESGKAEAVVEQQLQMGLAGVSESSLKSVTIAYEPVWAIGTGKTATPDDANAMHAYIRKVLSGLYSKKAGDDMVIQYGGSVKPANIKSLMAMPDLDGALVGGASLDAESFTAIARFDEQ